MKRKKVRQKAHKPGPRIPRYPAPKGPTGRQRRLGNQGFAAARSTSIANRESAKRVAAALQRAINSSGMYTARLERNGESPEWDDPSYWAVTETIQQLYINPLDATGDVIILKRAKPNGYDWDYKPITLTFYVVMPLQHAYWRHQALKAAMEGAGFSNFLKTLGSRDCYAITLPNIGVMVAGKLTDAEYIRSKMLQRIAAVQ